MRSAGALRGRGREPPALGDTAAGAERARAETALAKAPVARDRREELEEREFASEATPQEAIVAVVRAGADLAPARVDHVVADALVIEADADRDTDAAALAEDRPSAPVIVLGEEVAAVASVVERGIRTVPLVVRVAHPFEPARRGDASGRPLHVDELGRVFIARIGRRRG